MKYNIIFLDIDGVLNGYNKFTYFVGDICNKSKILSKLWYYWDVFSVRTFKIAILAIIVHTTHSKVVMSSSWRGVWVLSDEYLKKYKIRDVLKLKRLCRLFSVDIIDVTPNINGNREEEIKRWLLDNNSIVCSFVILDDESYDLQSFIGSRLVKTSKIKDDEIIKGRPYEDTGLKLKHIIEARSILKKPFRLSELG